MPISDYSATPASNTALFPEGMAPSQVNDSSRQVQADIRSWYNTAEWVDYGYTPTYVSATSFSMSGDRTSFYIVGRRIRITDSSTLYGTIATSAFATGATTVTVTMDSGSISASITATALSIISIPAGGTGSALGTIGTGNVTGQSSSVDSEIALFSGTGGKTIKHATGTGFVKVVSGVMQTPSAAAVTDLVSASTSGGVVVEAANGTDVANFGAGNTANATFYGALSMDTTNKIVNLADPTSAQDAATKAYVDSAVAGGAPVIVKTASASGTIDFTSSDLDFTNNLGYDFEISNLDVDADTRNVYVYASNNNLSGVILWENGIIYRASGTTLTAATETSGYIMHSLEGSPSYNATARFRITQPLTTAQAVFSGCSTFLNNSAVAMNQQFQGQFPTSAVLNAVRIGVNAGSMTTATIVAKPIPRA